MRRALLLALLALGGLAGVGAAVYPMLRPTPEAGGVEPRAAAPPAGGAPAAAPPVALKPRAGRALALDEAMRELDLIRPSRTKLAEDFTVPMVGGQRFKLSAERGKLVMINFWATWCPPCREEMPAMERLHRHHRDQGFVLLAVSVDAAPDKVQPFLDRYKLTFRVALDPTMDLANAYGVRALPSSFFVDRQGHLAALALGPRAWDNDASHSLVEGFLRR